MTEEGVGTIRDDKQVSTKTSKEAPRNGLGMGCSCGGKRECQAGSESFVSYGEAWQNASSRTHDKKEEAVLVYRSTSGTFSLGLVFRHPGSEG